MVYATADGRKGEKLRVGMVGGGRNAFIGAVHRFAMRLDDEIELCAGALSADPANAAASAAELGLASDRSYADYRAMAAAEAARPGCPSPLMPNWDDCAETPEERQVANSTPITTRRFIRSPRTGSGDDM